MFNWLKKEIESRTLADSLKESFFWIGLICIPLVLIILMELN